MTVDLASEQKSLFAHAPELNDLAARKRFLKALLRSAREYGYSRQEVEQIWDHRMMLVFRDAMTHLRLWEQP
jgi:hypothetical protein